jgi:hypothetical protein
VAEIVRADGQHASAALEPLGDITLQFNETQSFRVYSTVADMVQNSFQGSMSDETINVYTTGSNPPCPCGAFTNSRHCGSNFCIKDGDENRKFLIGHEYGHVNLENTAGSFNLDCSEGAPGSGNSHTMVSYEYMACAMMEGWADFVSADA